MTCKIISSHIKCILSEHLQVIIPPDMLIPKLHLCNGTATSSNSSITTRTITTIRVDKVRTTAMTSWGSSTPGRPCLSTTVALHSSPGTNIDITTEKPTVIAWQRYYPNLDKMTCYNYHKNFRLGGLPIVIDIIFIWSWTLIILLPKMLIHCANINWQMYKILIQNK